MPQNWKFARRLTLPKNVKFQNNIFDHLIWLSCKLTLPAKWAIFLGTAWYYSITQFALRSFKFSSPAHWKDVVFQPSKFYIQVTSGLIIIIIITIRYLWSIRVLFEYKNNASRIWIALKMSRPCMYCARFLNP